MIADTDTTTRDQPGEVGFDVQSRPNDNAGAIVIRLGLDGIRTVEIIADQSDEDDQLRERLTAARPVLEMLQVVMRASR